MSLSLITIVGARPQFVKASAVSREIASRGGAVQEKIVHTGQHHDANMSDSFFEELEIPKPAYHLGIAGGSHGAMTGRMLEAIEGVLLSEKPDWVLVYGDTNSTLAGALAAAKLHIPVAHVEAGLRSFNTRMPEEINRILTDRVSSLLFCPTDTAVQNLKAEGISSGIEKVGDVMYDVALFYRKKARKEETLKKFGLEEGRFVLATCHREENTDDTERLAGVCKGLALAAEAMPVIFPLHPRTRKRVKEQGIEKTLGKVQIVDPVPYLEMVALEEAACAIATDSGGMQKEAFFYGVPCLTLRDQTEWVETVETGWNRLVGADSGQIAEALKNLQKPSARPELYGDGHAAAKIIECLIGKKKGN